MNLLVPNWRRAWRMLSVQLAALAVVFGSLPADAQASVLDLVGVPAARVPAVLGEILAGILILVMPRLLNFIVAIYLIAIGLIGIALVILAVGIACWLNDWLLP